LKFVVSFTVTLTVYVVIDFKFYSYLQIKILVQKFNSNCYL